MAEVPRLAELMRPCLASETVTDEMLMAARLTCHLGVSLKPERMADADALLISLAYHAVIQGQACHIFREGQKIPKADDPKLIGGADSEGTPVLIRGNMVYLRRMDTLEARLAVRLGRLAQRRSDKDSWDLGDLDNSVPSDIRSNKMQFAAVRKLANSRLVIISGKPGTGKTYLLSALLNVAVDRGRVSSESIRLVAPTGRAARRMGESLRDPWKIQYDENGTPAGGLVPPQTIHSLMRQDDVFDDLELLVVDESSMVDLMLFEKLVAKITRDDSKCSLVLVGDANQLPSVEVGSVLRDLCDAGGLAANRVELTEPMRSSANPRIMLDADSVMNEAPSAEMVSGVKLLDTPEKIKSELVKMVCAGGVPFDTARDICAKDSRGSPQSIGTFGEMLRLADAGEPARALAMTDSVRVLCSQLKGDLGSETLSRAIADELGIRVTPTTAGCGALIMVTKNHRSTGLANGDVGIVARPAKDSSELLAYFKGRPRGYALSQLPEFIPAFATTIHKSQGSEYALSLVVLSAVERKGFLNKQLVYTAITRSKYHYMIFESASGVFKSACKEKVPGASGLALRLP